MSVDLFQDQAQMTVQCIDCQQFRLRDAGDMAYFGFGWCDLMKDKTRYPSATWHRICETFSQADQKTAADRRTWLAKQEQMRKVPE